MIQSPGPHALEQAFEYSAAIPYTARAQRQRLDSRTDKDEKVVED